MRTVFRPSREEILPTALFGLACLVGLVGAFVGLTASSLWIDELFTTWVIGDDSSLANVASRALTDSNPPLYYFIVFFFTRAFGDSDATFRVFSAICASAAILVLVCATARSFSLPARLFAAALATASTFWFAQSQNARALMRRLSWREQSSWRSVCGCCGGRLIPRRRRDHQQLSFASRCCRSRFSIFTACSSPSPTSFASRFS
jgi:hypothetical protein